MTDVPPVQPQARSTAGKVLIKVTLMLALCVGAAAVCGFFVLHSSPIVAGPAGSATTRSPTVAPTELTTVAETDPARAAAAEQARAAALAYLDFIRADDYHSAYDRQCAKIHVRLSESEFTAFQSVQRFGERIHSYTVAGTSLQQRDGRTTADVTFRVTDPVSPLPFTFHLVVEDGEWKVCE